MSIEDYNMPIVELGQESQCLQTSNSSATVAFHVPRTNRPSHTPPSLPQPFQHLQHGQSDGQPQRINPRLPSPHLFIGLVLSSIPFCPDLLNATASSRQKCRMLI
ncbi:hypothetical protein J007_04110 [Cryptococcus neoformans]|nr:hypothetical protein J007_04110 [Cryptococcus neoformans var. grubii]OXC60332.1 hypothetical protein C358_04225 [Cryptococcus neoformans var. grubii MW-RSA852]